MVKAKFKVLQCSKVNDKGAAYVIMLPVGGGNKENDQFFLSIPSGTCELCITDPEMAKQFMIGEEVYVEFNFKK